MGELDENKLLISEDFLSVQGEGISTGVPAYFIRLATCNLTCGATPKFVNQFKRDDVSYDPGSFKGDLHESGKATWTCDTIPVWARGIELPYEYLIERWVDEDILEEVANGIVHMIWTGGEPCIPKHQKAIVKFMRYFEEYCKVADLPFTPFVEIETNGTFIIDDDLAEWIDQINCSPKLSNSGLSSNIRINPAAVKSIQLHRSYQFKFVISTEDDIHEIFNTYINPFNIPITNVVCMPGLDDQKDFFERTRFCMEMAKKYKFIGLSRMHVAAWDRTTGV
jgi:7-carboxy-7-deazaguanine synthase